MLPLHFPPAFWGFRLAVRPASSTFPVALWLARIDRQPDGRALFPRDHRPVAFPTPPPFPRLGAEVTAQQEQEDSERGDADDPKNRISIVEHSQNFNRSNAEFCTFKPDGKSGAARTDELQPDSACSYQLALPDRQEDFGSHPAQRLLVPVERCLASRVVRDHPLLLSRRAGSRWASCSLTMNFLPTLKHNDA